MCPLWCTCNLWAHICVAPVQKLIKRVPNRNIQIRDHEGTVCSSTDCKIEARKVEAPVTDHIEASSGRGANRGEASALHCDSMRRGTTTYPVLLSCYENCCKVKIALSTKTGWAQLVRLLRINVRMLEEAWHDRCVPTVVWDMTKLLNRSN